MTLIDAQQADFNAREERHRAALLELEEERNKAADLRTQVRSLQDQVPVLRNQLSTAEEAHRQQLNVLESKRAFREDELLKIIATHKRELSALKERVQTLELASLDASVNVDQTVAQQLAESEKALQAKYEYKTNEAQSSYDRSIAEANREYQKELSRRSDLFDSSMTKQKQAHEAALKIKDSAYSDLMDTYRAARSTSDDRLKKLKEVEARPPTQTTPPPSSDSVVNSMADLKARFALVERSMATLTRGQDQSDQPHRPHRRATSPPGRVATIVEGDHDDRDVLETHDWNPNQSDTFEEAWSDTPHEFRLQLHEAISMGVTNTISYMGDLPFPIASIDSIILPCLNELTSSYFTSTVKHTLPESDQEAKTINWIVRRAVHLKRPRATSTTPSFAPLTLFDDDDKESVAESAVLGIDESELKPEGAKWLRLLDAPPAQQLQWCKESPHYKDLMRVVSRKVDNAGRSFYTRTCYRPSVVAKWVSWAFATKPRKAHNGLEDRVRNFSSDRLKFPPSLNDENPNKAAQAWERLRIEIMTNLVRAISINCDWQELLAVWRITANKEGTGNRVIAALLEEHCSDELLIKCPPLHADFIMNQYDISFGRVSSQYRTESQDHAWNACRERFADESLEGCGRRHMTAYMRKVDDPSITPSNMWSHKTHRDTFNTQLVKSIANDIRDRERGRMNAEEFDRNLSRLQREFEQSDSGDPKSLSGTYILQFVHDMEISRHRSSKAWTDPNESNHLRNDQGQRRRRQKGDFTGPPAAAAAAATPVTPGARSASPPAHRTPSIAPLQPPPRSVPPEATVTGSTTTTATVNGILQGPSSSVSRPQHDKGSMIRGRFGGRGQGSSSSDTSGYRQEAPPLNPGLPPPRHLLDQQQRMSSRSRPVPHPTGSTGHPWNISWDDKHWDSTLVDFWNMDKQAQYAMVDHLAQCWPADASRRTMASTKDIGHTKPPGGWPMDYCKYCYYRPRRDPSKASANSDWWYGDGQGNHDPHRCFPLKYFIATGGDSAKFGASSHRLQENLRFGKVFTEENKPSA